MLSWYVTSLFSIGINKFSCNCFASSRVLNFGILSIYKGDQIQVKVVQLGLPMLFYTMKCFFWFFLFFVFCFLFFFFQREGLVLPCEDHGSSLFIRTKYRVEITVRHCAPKKTPVCRRVYGNSVDTESSSPSRKENTKISKKCVPNRHTSSTASSRRRSKYTDSVNGYVY